MDLVKKHLTNGQYLSSIHEKISAFLHHTVGTTAMGAWRWWNSTPDRVGTPYIIDRDGTIYECFNPKYWAFHLGVRGDDNWHEKHSINVELVSAGPLRFVDGEYRFYPLWPNKIRFTVINPSEVYTFTKPWKGHEHWHLYTDDQLESLKWLLGRSTLDFPSLVFANDVDSIFEFNQSVLDNHSPGLWTHNTVRKDKSDPFPYPPLIKALKELQKELYNGKKGIDIPEVAAAVDKVSPPKKTVNKKKSSTGPRKPKP